MTSPQRSSRDDTPSAGAARPAEQTGQQQTGKQQADQPQADQPQADQQPAAGSGRRARRLLVFLHDAGQTPTVWQSQVASFAASTLMVAPWLAGTKPTARRPFDLDRAAGEVLGLALQHGVERLSLVGHGLGATVAVRAAGQAPELVDRLVLCAPQPAPPRWALRMQRVTLALIPRARLVDSGWTKADARGVLDALAEADLAGDLSRVRSPTLVVGVTGNRSTEALARLTASQVPNARLELVPGPRLVPSDQPEPFNQVLHQHLD